MCTMQKCLLPCLTFFECHKESLLHVNAKYYLIDFDFLAISTLVTLASPSSDDRESS